LTRSGIRGALLFFLGGVLDGVGEAVSLRCRLSSKTGFLSFTTGFEDNRFDFTAAVDESGIRKGL